MQLSIFGDFLDRGRLKRACLPVQLTYHNTSKSFRQAILKVICGFFAEKLRNTKTRASLPFRRRVKTSRAEQSGPDLPSTATGAFAAFARAFLDGLARCGIDRFRIAAHGLFSTGGTEHLFRMVFDEFFEVLSALRTAVLQDRHAYIIEYVARKCNRFFS